MSCKRVYNPDINASQDVLVVDGLITNEIQNYGIRLTRSSTFDNSSSDYKYVTGAKVSISDNLGNNYKVTEFRFGEYYTDSTELVGMPGRIYTLHIVTEDDNIYESSPQELLSSSSQDSVYAVNSTKAELVSDGNGGYNHIITAGIDLLTDITNNGDISPRFRFKSSITLLSTCGGASYSNTYSADDLVSLTEEKYTTTSLNIRGHIICFVPTVYIVKQDCGDAGVYRRTIKISRYRINNETYQYYKNINLLLSAQGKIFDPITTQFKGNITCINHPQKLALGFFEASSVKTNIYSSMPWGTYIYQIQNYIVLRNVENALINSPLSAFACNFTF